MLSLNVSTSSILSSVLRLIFLSIVTIQTESYEGTSTCSGRSSGTYPVKNDCMRYVRCMGAGIQFSSICKQDEVFDSAYYKCRKSPRFPCSASRAQKTLVNTKCHQEGEMIPSRIYCDKFLVCRGGWYYAIPCPYGQIFSNLAYKCLVPYDPCLEARGIYKPMNTTKVKNPYLGICDNNIGQNISDPTQCSMYIYCQRHPHKNTSLVMIHDCAPGLLFSEATRQCEAKHFVICKPRYRSRVGFGDDPKASDVEKWMEKFHPTTTTEKPKEELGRAFIGDVMAGVPDDSGRNIGFHTHNIILHEFGSKGNNSSGEPLLLRITLPKSIGFNHDNTQKHVFVEDIYETTPGGIPATTNNTAVITTPPHKDDAFAAHDYYVDETTASPQKVKTTGHPAGEKSKNSFDENTNQSKEDKSNKILFPPTADLDAPEYYYYEEGQYNSSKFVEADNDYGTKSSNNENENEFDDDGSYRWKTLPPKRVKSSGKSTNSTS